MDTPTISESKRPPNNSVASHTKRMKVCIEEIDGTPLSPVEKDKEKEKVRKKRGNFGPREGRRDRRGTRGMREESPVEAAGSEKKIRLPKRQCAVLLGFCGTGFSGMQIQPNARTIEGVLFEAMVKVGTVSADNADDPVKVGLKRAARTDAGVHAAANVVSIKMITSVPGVPDLVARINEELPPEIRLWSFVRTRNSFNAHKFCDSRIYTYFLPSYIILPPKPDSGLAKILSAAAGECGFPSMPSEDAFWNNGKIGDTTEDDLRRKRRWRINADRLAAFRLAATKYLGTHNFHNFTIGRDFWDRSNQRFIKSIEAQDPVVYGDTEWISILFHGQSFMFHQRKMVCALVLACRTGTPPEILEEMFGPSKVVVPKAPALGLLLEQPLFDGYNNKVAEANARAEPGDPNIRSLINFEPHRISIEQFKQDQIYSRMRAKEDKEAVFDAWIRSIDSYTGADFLYLNPKGTIPSAAILKKGQFRQNPFRERRRFDGNRVADSEALQDEEDEEDEQIDEDKLKDMEG